MPSSWSETVTLLCKRSIEKKVATWCRTWLASWSILVFILWCICIKFDAPRWNQHFVDDVRVWRLPAYLPIYMKLKHIALLFKIIVHQVRIWTLPVKVKGKVCLVLPAIGKYFEDNKEVLLNCDASSYALL